MVKKVLAAIFFFLTLATFTPLAFAHEAYVLTQNQFNAGLQIYAQNPFAPLLSSQYLKVSVIITISIIALYLLNVIWSTTDLAGRLDKLIKKARVGGPLIIRAAISASFFYAAFANSFLGPEISLSSVPHGALMKFFLFTMSLMILFGVFVEAAAFLGILLFTYVAFYYNFYMLTYLNYLGELIVLLLFGSRTLSFDKYFFGDKLWFEKLKKYKFLEVPIVRVLYGCALIYAGVSIKFLHQILSVEVYNEYHLANFFHASAQFIAAGAGLSEVLIGLLIILGLSQRLTIFISLVFITLSILYFRELLWPHFMLYGISFSLLINSADRFTLDSKLVPFARNLIRKLANKSPSGAPAS